MLFASWESHWPSCMYTHIKFRLYMKSNIAVGERLPSVTTEFVYSRRRSNIIHNCLQRKWMTWKLHKYGRRVGVTKKKTSNNVHLPWYSGSFVYFKVQTIGTPEPLRQILTYKPVKLKIIFTQLSRQSSSKIHANKEFQPEILKRNFTNYTARQSTYRASTAATSTHRLYILPPHRLRNNCNNNDFTPFYFILDNFNVLNILLI